MHPNNSNLIDGFTTNLSAGVIASRLIGQGGLRNRLCDVEVVGFFYVAPSTAKVLPVGMCLESPSHRR